MLCAKCNGMMVTETCVECREWDPASRGFITDEVQHRCLNCGLIDSRLIRQNGRVGHIEPSSPRYVSYSPVPECLPEYAGKGAA